MLTPIRAFKGYLCYKMITSQIVPSEAQIKNFFISKKNYVPFWRYSSFCIFNHPMIYKICDVTMSIIIWDNMHFWIIFWTTTHEVTKLGLLIDISKGNNLLNNLENWDYIPGPFHFSNIPQLLNNQLCQDSSVSFFVKRWVRDN